MGGHSRHGLGSAAAPAAYSPPKRLRVLSPAMPERICYTVTATIRTAATVREYLDWLRSGHLDQVVQAGAESGMIVHLDPESATHGGPYEETDTGGRVVTQYVFRSREAFHRYERDHAPALRADGVERFGPRTGKGVTFTRTVGLVLHGLSSSP